MNPFDECDYLIEPKKLIMRRLIADIWKQNPGPNHHGPMSECTKDGCNKRVWGKGVCDLCALKELKELIGPYAEDYYEAVKNIRIIEMQFLSNPD